MRIYPAIDLRGGQVVRLYQGDYDQETVYAQDPVAVARSFRDQGAKYLHLVDLDGARDGAAGNFDAVAAVAALSGLRVEVGGGIRDEAGLRACLDAGADRCILGTAAVTNFPFVARMAEKYGPRIAVGVDARDGLAAVNGWRELSGESGPALCRRLYAAGVQSVVYTDIARDGAEAGTNLAVYRKLADIKGLAVTASGGISSLAELEALERMGVAAAILGKALYTGGLRLEDVLAAFPQA